MTRPRRDAVSRSITDVRFKARLLLVGIDVRQHGTALQGLDETRHEGIELVRVVALQGELILGIARSGRPCGYPARIAEKAARRHLLEFVAQAGDHLVGGLAALGFWLQVDEDQAGVGLARASAGIALRRWRSLGRSARSPEAVASLSRIAWKEID